MKDKIILVAFFAILISILPLFLPARAAQDETGEDPSPQLPPIADGTQNGEVGDVKTEEVVFTVLNVTTNEAMELCGLDYITRVVAAEVPASFETEALKAQTVAALTYALNRKETHVGASVHEGCDLCTDSRHCKAYASDERLREKRGDKYEENLKRVSDAVASVYGEYMVYEDEPIVAVFHAISAGKTEAAVNVWGHEYPYLQSADSVGDESVRGYESTKTFTAAEFKKIMSEYSADCAFDPDESRWIGDIARSEAGYVQTVRICGVLLAGTRVRALFDLRSACFTLKYADGEFTFTVHGYGHGVGMSQYGANEMAKEGATYREILDHYYKDIGYKNIF